LHFKNLKIHYFKNMYFFNFVMHIFHCCYKQVFLGHSSILDFKNYLIIIWRKYCRFGPLCAALPQWRSQCELLRTNLHRLGIGRVAVDLDAKPSQRYDKYYFVHSASSRACEIFVTLIYGMRWVSRRPAS